MTAETARCSRCKRRLTAVASIKAEIGRTCKARRKAEVAVAADFTPAQVVKALQLIADGGLVPTSRRGVYRAVSSSGEVTYLVHAKICGCPAGLHQRLCYHMAGVRMLAATRKAA